MRHYAGVLLTTIFLLGGCAQQNSAKPDKPLIEGRPTLEYCNGIKQHAYDLRQAMQYDSGNPYAIRDIARNYQTILSYDGCQWVYASPQGFEDYFFDRKKEEGDLLQDYADALVTIQEQQQQLEDARVLTNDILHSGYTIEQYRTLIEQMGSHVVESESGATWIRPEGVIDLSKQPVQMLNEE